MNVVFASEKYWNEGNIVEAKRLLSWVRDNANTTLDLTTDMIYGTHLVNAMQSYRFLRELLTEPLGVMEKYSQQVAAVIETKVKAQRQKIDAQQLAALMKLIEDVSEFVVENAPADTVGNQAQNTNRAGRQTVYWTCAYHPQQRFYSSRMPGAQGCSYSPDKRHVWTQHTD
jgi:hypothetical protein